MDRKTGRQADRQTEEQSYRRMERQEAGRNDGWIDRQTHTFIQTVRDRRTQIDRHGDRRKQIDRG
jgi:hypothetical protein